MCSQYPFIHFTQGEYRNDLIHLWHEKLTEFGVPRGKSASLIATLGDPLKIRSWQIAGTSTLFSLELHVQTIYLPEPFSYNYPSNSVCICFNPWRFHYLQYTHVLAPCDIKLQCIHYMYMYMYIT